MPSRMVVLASCRLPLEPLTDHSDPIVQSASAEKAAVFIELATLPLHKARTSFRCMQETHARQNQNSLLCMSSTSYGGINRLDFTGHTLQK